MTNEKMTNEEVIEFLKFQMSYYCDLKGCEELQAYHTAIKAIETVERIEARKQELEKKMHSSFSLTEANEHYALTKLLREAESADCD